MTDADRTERWAVVGRTLARARLEHQATDLAVTLRQTAISAHEGDLSADQLRECYFALRTTEILLDELASVPDEFDR